MHSVFQIVSLILRISIIAQVFATGLGTTLREATYLFRQPRRLLNSILARNVAVPIIAVLLIKSFSLHVAASLAIGILAVTPVPPLLPKSQLKAGGRSNYVLGLLVSQAVLAIVLVPITIRIMDLAFNTGIRFSAGQVASIVLTSILIPLAAGRLASKLLPGLQQFAPFLLTVGTVLLIVGTIPLLYLAWRSLIVIAGNGALLALSIFIVAGTAVGHLFGGPSTEDRGTLGVATSARHPAIAIAVAQANFPDQTALVAGTVVIYLLLRLVLEIPYIRWLRKARALTTPA